MQQILQRFILLFLSLIHICGKSHFLKILSYLLQNKQVGDKHAIDYFIEDQKITNQMVLADMQLAANTPSDVILFNIDSKSDSNGKENKDAIVNVFLKVFNEMQGFCGSMPHLADLERRLSEEGRFEEFKDCLLYTSKDGDDLEITVSDNGAGMTQEMIRSVMAGKARNNGEDRYSTGIAVGNVIDRLELYYKQKGLLTIESDGLGLGTSVHITLPVEVEGTSE